MSINNENSITITMSINNENSITITMSINNENRDDKMNEKDNERI